MTNMAVDIQVVLGLWEAHRPERQALCYELCVRMSIGTWWRLLAVSTLHTRFVVGSSRWLPLSNCTLYSREAAIPDFVFSSKHSALMEQFREKVLCFDCESFTILSIYTLLRPTDPRLKEFKIDSRRGIRTDADLIPPPVFSTFQVPYNYA